MQWLRSLLVALFLFAGNVSLLAEVLPAITLSQTTKPVDIISRSKVWCDAFGKITFPAVQKHFSQTENQKQSQNCDASVRWLHFKITQNHSANQKIYIAIPFTDIVELYSSVNESATFQYSVSGDLVAMPQRQVKNGQMVFLEVNLPKAAVKSIFLKLESKTNISHQFKSLALNSIRIYSEKGFVKRFEQNRIYQALFYGALCIMMLYNIVLSFTLASKSYLYYVLFLFFICLFLGANNGYLFELFLPGNPRLDLYIRFASTPLLMLSYLFFSEQFLRIRINLPKAYRFWQVLTVFFALLLLVMISGFWKTGRTLTIFSSVISFIFLLAVSLRINRNGFASSRYFIIANILLLAGGIIFALSRFNIVVQSTLTQYSVQIAILFQVALLSLGLADRINIFRKQLATQVLENEKLKLLKEQEQKRLIEEKNIELQEKIIESTAEVVRQKEDLAKLNTELEKIVDERTHALSIANTDLQEVNSELAAFIYRTSHDVRGPLSRLLGLCNVGLLDVNDLNALQYLEKIQLTAHKMDIILKRLSKMFEISQLEPQQDEIDFAQLVNEICTELAEFQSKIEIEIQSNIKYIADEKLMRFILFNLIQNALKFSTLTKDQISIVKIKIKTTDNFIEIQVADNGIGVSNEEAQFIFQMFSQVGLKYQNTGLGLYMVKKILDKMDGNILLHNNTAGFTQFSVYLPITNTQKSFQQMQKPLSTGM